MKLTSVLRRIGEFRVWQGLFLVAVVAGSSVGLRAVAAPQPQEPKQEEGWISLFNGKDLTGWTVKIRGHEPGDNFGDTFRVEDGVMKVAYDKYDKFDERFGHIYTDKAYSNYRLRVEYRFTGPQCPGGPGWATRNSGAMIHSQAPETMTKDQDFPVSIEVQYLGGNGKVPRHTSNVCTPGTNIVQGGKLITQHCTDSTSKTYPLETWVTAEVEVHGDGVIKHILDGETVIEYEQPQLDPTDANAKKLIKDSVKLLKEGRIALQSESHPVEFRKVELLPLDK